MDMVEPAALGGRCAPRLRALAGHLGSVGLDPADPTWLRDRKSLLVLMTVLVQPAGLVWGGLYWGFGEHVAALFPWGYAPASLLTLLVFSRTRNFAFFRTAQLLLILLVPALLLLSLGGITPASGVILWSLLAPVGAVVFDAPRRAWVWFAAFVGLLAATVPLAPVVRSSPTELPDAVIRAFAVLNVAAPSLVVFALLSAFALQREAAQGRVERLLLNVLPGEIAERLQTSPNAIADQFDDASVLFADVVDFTPLSSRLSPTELVGLLDRLFTAFDELADRYGVEKIKTIGDCYMVAAGVPAPRPDHAHALASMALEMHDLAAKTLPAEGHRALELRIGISSGPVVAGVIGRRRFLYDLWGDTVNMASRMESHGTPGDIQVTRSTWELIRDDFQCAAQGLVDVKGKGPVETWQLVRRA
jgi:adenylate cyclase